MGMRTVPVVTRDLRSINFKAVLVPQNASTQIIADTTRNDPYEIALIRICNTTNAQLFFNLGGPCDNVTNFDGSLGQNQFIDIPTREVVNCFTTNAQGCLVGIQIIKREELGQAPNILTAQEVQGQ